MIFKNLVTYLILGGIIVLCLYYQNNSRENFIISKPGTPTNLKVEVESLDSLKVSWLNGLDPIGDPIKGHIIMLSTVDNPSDSTYLNFSNKTKCAPECQYQLSNLNLKEGVEYKISVLAVNETGSSDPSVPFLFKAIPQITPTPESVTEAPFSTPAPTPAFLEDVIVDDRSKTYFDQQLEQMVVRAEKVFEMDKDKLSYADIEASVQSLEDPNPNALQENRLNINLQVNK